MATIVNRGTGAGGANTNVTGLAFEDRTSNEPRLLADGFVRTDMDRTKNGYYLSKTVEDGTHVVFTKQAGLGKYMQNRFDKSVDRHPDEAYILTRGDVVCIRILEKKNQNVDGSVDTKLLAGPAFVSLYKKKTGMDVNYAFCVSDFLKQKCMSARWRDELEILESSCIPLLFGDDEDYFTQLDAWIYS
jgi:hypothetical protein